MYALVIVIGILVGLEIPLLMRIVRDRYHFRDVVAHVLTFDYLGALGASLLFPILLVPHLGLVRSAMLFGILNAAVALWSTFLFANQLARTAVAAHLLRRRACCALASASLKPSASRRPPRTTFTPTRSSSPATHATSTSS